MATINGTTGNNTLNGSTSDDVISGLSGADSVLGNAGNDLIYGDTGAAGSWRFAVYDRDFSSANGQAGTVSSGTLRGTGYTSDFDVATLANTARGTTGDPNDFGVVLTSTLNPTTTGTYRFNLTSDDGSIMVIRDSNGNAVAVYNQDGQTLSYLNNDYHQAATTRWGEVTLTAGETYTIEITYWENLGGNTLGATVTPPGGTAENLLTSSLVGTPPQADVTLAGNDTLNGGDGNDTIFGNGGNDSLLGGTGNDSLSGDAGNDTLWGGIGNDTLAGGEGADTLYGEDGADTLDGGAGNDSLSGGTGNDTLHGGVGADTLAGSQGMDYADYSDSGAAVSINLNAGTATGGDATGDVISGIDGIYGSAYNDTLIGSDAFSTDPADTYTSIIYGNAGNDSIDGAGGDDSLYGGADNDTILGGAGNDYIEGGTGADSAIGGAGNDTLYLGDGNDSMGVGDTGDDLVYGEGGDDVLSGDAGNDTIYGGIGNDAIEGHDGADTIYGEEGDDYLAGFDVTGITYPENRTLNPTVGSDDGSADYIDGGTGNDTVLGGAGNDTLLGGADNDHLDGGTGADSLEGGDGDDTLLGGDGNDYLAGGSGANSYDGGLGSDTIYAQLGGTGTINGSEDGDNSDTDVLYLQRGGVVASITYDSGNSENGTITWSDGSTTSFTNIENVQYVPCFTPGTMVETKDGLVAVENLVPGQRVLTRDNGYQPVRWIGRRRLSAAELAARPQLQPVRIGRGALGQGLPEVDMVVSPQHRMLLTGTRAELFFGEAEVLAAALHLVGNPGIERLVVDEVTYLHIMFDAHEIIRADGAWTESFQPGDMTLRGLDDPQRDELFAIFPELRHQARPGSWAAARLSLKAHEVRVLMAA